MSTPRAHAAVSRRTALAGLGAGGLGVAMIATARQASAQDGTPASMTGHPLVGTWIVTRNADDPTLAPVLLVFTAEGSLIDPGAGAAGVWQATGPRSAA